MREQHNQYAFEVAPEANKHEIKQAVEHFFGVKVTAGADHELPRQDQADGPVRGQACGLEEGVVTLAQGETIDLFEIV